MSLRKAAHDNVKLRIALCGESNSGKTFSALILAQAISGNLKKTAIIDTECRGDLYSKHFVGYGISDFVSPFTPELAIEKINECAKAGIENVIFDSASDVWEGTLQIHSDLVGTNYKSSWPMWGKVGPRWDAFRTAINNYPGNVFTTWRMKEKLTPINGKMVNEGLKVIARGGAKGIKFDYQVAFVLNDKHEAVIGKDNLHLFTDWKEPSVITEAVGLKIKDWCLNK